MALALVERHDGGVLNRIVSAHTDTVITGECALTGRRIEVVVVVVLVFEHPWSPSAVEDEFEFVAIRLGELLSNFERTIEVDEVKTVRCTPMTKILQFSTPSCSQCPQQAEILQSLTATRPNIEFEKIDATEATDRANKYGVRSVPSTIVLDGDGEVVSKFDGLTQATAIKDAL
ncbi:thioredoxin domain-containing protein [Halorussus aquaticus]|uniref:Thioredoxin domain-containing protein n=1 Tax=Halorussus aquaticus TaxID=2953748 RepID=A0ABD5Q847_9EURY|nr:thioredoxin domain-containing protein [Halorussus aquaticus]